MSKKVIVTSCEDSRYWYADKIGMEFEIITEYDHNKKMYHDKFIRGDYLVSNHIDHVEAYICKKDCQLVK